ncbi:MAG: hypothetical protein ACR2H0_08675, partial [Candidatus Limnocylindrales bacterium]
GTAMYAQTAMERMALLRPADWDVVGLQGWTRLGHESALPTAIRRAVQNGINTDAQTIFPPVRASAVGVGGPAIYNNTITDGWAGIDIGDDGHVIYGNESHTNSVGIRVTGIDNHIHDNDFRSNTLYDCTDTSPLGGGTANTSNLWTSNQGNTDLPDGICIADAP